MNKPVSGRKPTSPLMDALRLFLHNKPAVFALGMILLLAFAAISGQALVGKKPTDDQLALMEKAEVTGDTLDMQVNRNAVLDHTKTELKDTFERPYISTLLAAPFGGYDADDEEFIRKSYHDRQLAQGVSEDKIVPLTDEEVSAVRKEGISSDGEKTYYLGTDDLGRDVLARLWAGSSISLTIGFLAVGISVLLGITLGGIAGYFGRSRVRLPLLATLLLTAAGGILWAAEFVAAAVPLLVLAGLFFLVQLAMAVMGKRYKSAIAFAVVLAISFGVMMYNRHVETSTPEGMAFTHASLVADQSYELLREIRDLGSAQKLVEDKDPDALEESDVLEMQLAIEHKQAELDLELVRHDLIVHQAQVEIAERSVPEHEDRVEYLRSLGLEEDAAAVEKILEGEKKRLEGLSDKAEALEKAIEEQQGKTDAALEQGVGDIKLQSSNALLERRADLRGKVVSKFRAERDNRFETLVKGKTLDGSTRYSTYRVLRHFLTAVILYLLLVVTSLLVAADAQAASGEDKGPLSKVFIPTITVDDLVMRFTEIMLTIPVLFLILMVLALFERDVYIVMAVIGLTSWMGTTRFVRAEILSLREQDFIQAARALGVSDSRIIWRHLVPNAISPVLVSATIGVAGAVLAESTLSFLGIGAGPDQDTWGKILADGRLFLQDAAWLTWIPGIAILITVLSFNLLGEGLREAFNPKLRGR